MSAASSAPSAGTPNIERDIHALEAALTKKGESVDVVRDAVANIARHKPAVDRGEVTGGTAQALRAVLAKALERPELKVKGLLELAIGQMRAMRGKLDDLLGPDQGPKAMEAVPEGLKGALRALRELVTRVRDNKAALDAAQANDGNAFLQTLFPTSGEGKPIIAALVAGRGKPFMEGEERELGREITQRTMELSGLITGAAETERRGIGALREELYKAEYIFLRALLRGDVKLLQDKGYPAMDQTALFRIRAKILKLKKVDEYPRDIDELFAFGVRVENLPELAANLAVELTNLSAPVSHGPRPAHSDHRGPLQRRMEQRGHGRSRLNHIRPGSEPRPEPRPAPAAAPAAAPAPAAHPDPEAHMIQPPEDLRGVYNSLKALVRGVRGNSAALAEARGSEDPFLRAIFGTKESDMGTSILSALDAKNNISHDELRGKIEAETAKLRALLDQHQGE